MEAILFQDTILHEPTHTLHMRPCDLRVREGKIIAIRPGGSLNAEPGEKVLKGGHLSIGWVDMRVHLSVPGHEEKEDLHSLAQAGVAGGYTRLLTLPNTHPAIDNAGQVRALIQQVQSLPIRMMVAGALSVGSKGEEMAELYDMQQAGASAFTDGIRSVKSAGMLLRALQYCRPFGGLLLHTPLDNGLAGGAEVAEGVNATLVGMKGIPALAEELGMIRDLKLFAHDPHRLHLGPITTAQAAELIPGPKPAGLSIEVSALHLLLDDSRLLDFDVNAKVWPPLRSADDVAAIRQAVLDGKVDAISSNHHPQSVEEKQHDFADAGFGAEMLETSFAAARTALTGPEGLAAVLQCLGAGPRRVLGLDTQIVEGNEAELTHFDPDFAWTPTLADLRSKAKNNPLLGTPLTGKALGVVAKGRYIA